MPPRRISPCFALLRTLLVIDCLHRLRPRKNGQLLGVHINVDIDRLVVAAIVVKGLAWYSLFRIILDLHEVID